MQCHETSLNSTYSLDLQYKHKLWLLSGKLHAVGNPGDGHCLILAVLKVGEVNPFTSESIQLSSHARHQVVR